MSRRRIVVLLALVAALGFGAIAVLGQSGSAHPSSIRPVRRAFASLCSRFASESAARQQIVTGRGPRVVVIGDSYAVGRGLRRPADGWTRSLPGEVHVFGFTGSGFSRTASPCAGASYAERAAAAVTLDPVLVVVEGGLNDVGQPPARVLAGFKRLMRLLHGQDVVVVGPADAPMRARGARRVDRLLSGACARAGVRYVSMIGDQFRYLPSGLHLTPVGHRAFGADVRRAILGSTR